MYFEDHQNALMALPEERRVIPEQPEEQEVGPPVGPLLTKEKSTPGIWALWGPAFDRDPNREAAALEEYSREFRPRGMTAEQFWSGITQETVVQFYGVHQMTRLWHTHPDVESRWVQPNRFACHTLEELLAVIAEVALEGDADCPDAQAACQAFVEQVQFPEVFWQGAFWRTGPITEEGIKAIDKASRTSETPDMIYCPRS